MSATAATSASFAADASYDTEHGKSTVKSTIAESPIKFSVRRASSVMPWDSGLVEDRRFKRWMMHGFGVCATMAALVTFLPHNTQPVVDQTTEREQYAKLVIEEKIIPKPPEPVKKPEVKKEEVKPKPVKPVAKVKEKVKPVKVEKAKVVEVKQPPKPTEAELRAKAREKAAKSGLLALADELKSIRQTTDTSSVTNLKSGVSEAKQIKRKLLAANTNTNLSANAAIVQQQNTVGLATRESADIIVSSQVVEALSVEQGENYGDGGQRRSADEVRRVMDANKGAVYSVYNRALRKNPALQGTLTFSMTIEPSGSISQIEMQSSELADPTLEKRLLSRIRMIKFEEAAVLPTQVNYSFDFLPY